MNSEEKKCPRCAEMVKAEAKICKHCGYNFETGLGPDTHVGPIPPDASKKKQSLMGCFGLAVLVVVAIVIFGGEDGAQDVASTRTNAARPALKVTAHELAAAYEANEAAAQQRYGGGPLEVTATVQSIDLGIGDEPYLVLEGPNEFMGPQAHLTEASQAKASGISKGQVVSLRCAGVGEIVGTPMLKDCEID